MVSVGFLATLVLDLSRKLSLVKPGSLDTVDVARLPERPEVVLDLVSVLLVI